MPRKPKPATAPSGSDDYFGPPVEHATVTVEYPPPRTAYEFQAVEVLGGDLARALAVGSHLGGNGWRLAGVWADHLIFERVKV
jgi:hypothetical protein